MGSLASESTCRPAMPCKCRSSPQTSAAAPPEALAAGVAAKLAAEPELAVLAWAEGTQEEVAAL